MKNKPTDSLPHFILSGTCIAERFRSVGSGPRPKPLPNLDRTSHGRALLGRLSSLREDAAVAKSAQEAAGLDAGFGLQIEFRSFPDVELAFESLPRTKEGIELLNVKREGTCTSATVFVPDGKLNHFEKIISEYVEEKKDRNGNPRDHKALVNTIEDVRAAAFDALWTDSQESLPESDDEEIWWEIWLPVLGDRQATTSRFRKVAALSNLQVSDAEIVFPDRTVVLMCGSRASIKGAGMVLNSIAEIRRGKETAEFFDGLTPEEQHEWVDHLLERTAFADEDGSPYVCILDTGVNIGHPLIKSSLHPDDLHTNFDDPADDHGHGTAMAGVALFGDLSDALDADGPITIPHRLESVKLLRSNGDNDDKHHGNLTIQAVSRPEITAPSRRRVYAMAVTSKDARDRGRPSAWSATLDRLAADCDGDGLSPRLIVISGGNVEGHDSWMHYPYSNSSNGIHDPGQAWNALTVGAYTEKTTIQEKGAELLSPIAPSGGLSPFSTTSMPWERASVFKPDVVFEGGNVAKDSSWACTTPSLSLLTTYHKPHSRLLSTITATSAATAQCARMAAQLMASYPSLWPETVRALIVHSAQWTEPMMHMFMTGGSKTERLKRLIKHCGFGAPDFHRANCSMRNSLTLIVQETLQPFEKEKGKIPSTRDMHLHRLPWPLEKLEELGAVEVEMQVTLSYFIEPNPAERGFKGSYKYESHGLRFDVMRPLESETEFRYRINRLVRDLEEGTPTDGSDPGWDLGTKLRHLGSVHSDTWRGQAVQLARRGSLAVFPIGGWWKTRTSLERYNKLARYGLIVSIRAPEVDVDLYTVVRNMVETPVYIKTTS